MKDKVMRDLYAYKDYYDFDNLGRVINAAYLQIETESLAIPASFSRNQPLRRTAHGRCPA
jgi:hypothetical protein